MIKVGISGKIASGKSEAEKIIKSLNYQVFDLDVISREIFQDDSIQKEIMNEFQTLNRKEIAQIIFENKEKKKNLEKIIHPKLKEAIFELFEKYKNEKVIFISGALLFESGFYKFFDKTIFIDADENIRLERLMKRNNLSYSEAKKRLNMQDSANLADYIIENNENFDNLKIKIEKVIKLIDVA